MTPRRCQERECDPPGEIDADGYCATCGTKATDEAAADGGPGKAKASTGTSLTGARGTLITGSARSKGTRRRTTSPGTASQPSGIGAGLVNVPAAANVDPAQIVIENPLVSEGNRFCGNCGNPVGLSRSGRPGLLSGYCAQCGHRFDFHPKLRPGQVVDGQYRVEGCIAHGGMGWVYLASDMKVHDRPVALKGLLNAADPEAMAVAVAEARFLAQIEHPSIVRIYNSVSHANQAYIVMEYAGGPSLHQILVQRRKEAGRPCPLPVDQAIAYVLAVLPAFSYLHARSLIYCDFKPENLIQVGDQVKLIDVGAVRWLDDAHSGVYGTDGFRPPEFAEESELEEYPEIADVAGLPPSPTSDLYTVGRTLAILTLDYFAGYHTRFRYSLPDPADHPSLARFDSFHRFLLKATAPHPDDRFQSAAEMGDQLLGVLREVVAVGTDTPQPAVSTVFGPVTEHDALAPVAVDPGDPASSFLSNVASDGAGGVLRKIDDAVSAGQISETAAVRLRRAEAFMDIGDHEAVTTELDKIEDDDPWEWRAVYLRGLNALATADLTVASTAFDRCWSEVPGELAPKLAVARSAERAGDLASAIALYELIVRVDPAYVAAAAGLARCRAREGDVVGELAAYDGIPSTHRAYADGQRDAVRTLIRADQYGDAGKRLSHLQLDQGRRAELEVDLFDAALQALTSSRLPPSAATRIVGRPFEERSVRLGLEDALRRVSRFKADPAERYHYIDRANEVRPRTLL